MLAFTRLTDPFLWFVLVAVFSAVVWVVFVYDLKMIRQRIDDSPGENGCALYAVVMRNQRLNIRLIVPGVFLFNVAAAAAIRFAPGFCVRRRGHLIFICAEAAGLLLYLLFLISSFIKMPPLIAATQLDWRRGAAA